MEKKPNPFESDLSIQAIQLITFIDGGGDRIGQQYISRICCFLIRGSKFQILLAKMQYLKNYNGTNYKASIEMLIDLFFELINEGFLVLNSL